MIWLHYYFIIAVAFFVVMGVVVLSDGDVRRFLWKHRLHFPVFVWFFICAIIWPLSIIPVVFNSKQLKKRMIDTLQEHKENM